MWCTSDTSRMQIGAVTHDWIPSLKIERYWQGYFRFWRHQDYQETRFLPRTFAILSRCQTSPENFRQERISYPMESLLIRGLVYAMSWCFYCYQMLVFGFFGLLRTLLLKSIRTHITIIDNRGITHPTYGIRPQCFVYHSVYFFVCIHAPACLKCGLIHKH